MAALEDELHGRSMRQLADENPASDPEDGNESDDVFDDMPVLRARHSVSDFEPFTRKTSTTGDPFDALLHVSSGISEGDSKRRQT